MNAITPVSSNVEAYRASTDAAGLCKEIVVKTAMKIQNKRYVTVEGWQAIAIAHGCTASADNVERVNDEGMTGFKATGMIRRMSDGIEIARAEGFLGDDEGMWAKRPVYARRAMAQTRAISRACRSAFAHVVVMMDAGLATTPAEEIPHDSDNGGPIIDATPTPVEPAARQKLEGPHSSKTALRKAVHDLIAEVRRAQSLDALKGLIRDHRATLAQAQKDWPNLISGDPDIAEDQGFDGAYAERRAELDPDTMVNRAIRDMHENCRDVDALASWRDTNSAYLEQLDGAESRRFQSAYDEYEAGLSRAEEAAGMVASG